MTSYYKRLRDIIRRNHPDAVLYLGAMGSSKGALDNIFGSYFGTWEGSLKEVGIDLERLEKTPGIAVVPVGVYGRAKTSLIECRDKMNLDSLLDPERRNTGGGKTRGFRFTNDYFEFHERVPTHLLGTPDMRPGGYCGGAEAAGRNCLEKLAVTLAEQDSNMLIQGGWINVFGRPEVYRDWLSAYRALPRERFETLDVDGDSVVVRYRRCKDGLYFYLVSRESYAIDVSLRLDGVREVISLSTGEKPSVDAEGSMRVPLRPFDLQSFRMPGKGILMGAVMDIPRERIELVWDRVNHARALARQIEAGVYSDSVSKAEKAQFRKSLDVAIEALEKHNYWRARCALGMSSVVRIFKKLNNYPDGLIQRQAAFNILRRSVPDRYRPKEPPLLEAEALRSMAIAGEGDVRVVESSSYNEAWRFTQVLECDGAMRLGVNIPVDGTYRLTVGYVTKQPGMIRMKAGEALMPLPIMMKNANAPDKMVFPSIALPAGQTVLSFNGMGEFGIYALQLTPDYDAIPSDKWMTIGPFPDDAEPGWRKSTKALRRVMARVDPPMRELDFDAEYSGADGRKVRWGYSDQPTGKGLKHFNSAEGLCFLDRCKVYNDKVCYAVTFIDSPEARDVEILVGADWWANAWLNGEKLVTDRAQDLKENDGAEFCGWRPTVARGKLQKGRNTLLVKSRGGQISNWILVYISNPGDLKISPKYPSAQIQ